MDAVAHVNPVLLHSAADWILANPSTTDARERDSWRRGFKSAIHIGFDPQVLLEAWAYLLRIGAVTEESRDGH